MPSTECWLGLVGAHSWAPAHSVCGESRAAAEGRRTATEAARSQYLCHHHPLGCS